MHRLYRRFRYGRPVIVVSGLPRSGTSMMMRMLGAGGLELVTDGERDADEDNPRGYYEDERVKALEGGADAAWLAAARGRAVKVISYLLKELPPNLNYRVLFLLRPLSEVLASQAKMLARRGEAAEAPDERMAALFEEHLLRVRVLLRHRPWFSALEVHYGEVLSDPLQQALSVRRFLGLPLDAEAMAAAVDPALYRNRSGG